MDKLFEELDEGDKVSEAEPSSVSLPSYTSLFNSPDRDTHSDSVVSSP